MPNDTNIRLLHRAANGNAAAADWLMVFYRYAHHGDDILDGDVPPSEYSIAALLAHQLYNHPYYTRHAATLGPLVLAVSIAHMNATKFEKHEDINLQRVADIIRSQAIDVVVGVNLIEADYASAVQLHADLWQLSCCEQRKPN